MTKLKLLEIILLISLANNVCGQINDQTVGWEKQTINDENLFKKEYKDTVLKYDFSLLWLDPDNNPVYGFIGDNYQRIRIKFISVEKDKNNPEKYTIVGKSMVKNNICQFMGTIRITKARIYKKMHWGVDSEYYNRGIKKEGILIAEYHFVEESTQKDSGIFDGLLCTAWFIDKTGNLKYDNVENFSDSYINNQFVGIWKGYKNKFNKVCNWGESRVPLSGDLDIGAGEFSPADKYLQYGWKTYRDAYTNNNKYAKQEEEKKWWK
jgi:hypothetical protein